MKRAFRVDKSIIILSLILLVAVGAAVFFYMTLKGETIGEMRDEDDALSVAFFFTDGDDLIFTNVFFYNFETHKGALLDIPGETGAIISSLGRIDRIDVLWDSKDPETYFQKIEDLVGRQLATWVRIDMSGLTVLVDWLEGLEVFIANPVSQIDDEKSVLLPSGSVLLDGDKIKTYISYLDEEEESRRNRQGKFMQAFLSKMGDRSDTLLHNSLSPLIEEQFDHEMSRKALLSLIEELALLDYEHIVFQGVLGVYREVDGQNLLFRHYEGKLLRETVKQTVDSIANVDVVSADDLNVTVKILNGTGVNGLASRTSQIFKSFGYDIVAVGNAESQDVAKTKVLDRRDNISQAQRAANVIKCRLIETQPEESESGAPGEESADITIILGKDFDGRYCTD